MNDSTELARKCVVTAFLRHRGKILIMRRSDAVGSYRGRWSGVSGFLEDTTPLTQALREIREETALHKGRLRLIKSGKPLEIPAPELGTLWVVHPFLFDLDDPAEIHLDWENIEFEWVAPQELGDYPTVPHLAEALDRCL
jgi:8-oxo-dGTP pyrophosphatase MutT (NUDIX family)